MTTTQTPVKTLEHYVTAIMSMIDHDIAGDAVPATVASFSELHDHVDANEYMIDADVPFDPDSDDAQTLYTDVQDEVTNRLAQRAGLTVGAQVHYFPGKATADLRDGVILEAYRSEGGRKFTVTIAGTDGVERTLDVADIRIPAADEV